MTMKHGYRKDTKKRNKDDSLNQKPQLPPANPEH